MAKHLRQQCLEKMADLVDGLTTTGSRVYRSRVYPLESAALPGLLVFQAPQTERAEAVTMAAPRTYQRVTTLAVAAVARASAALDDVLNQMALEVEKALALPLAEGVSVPWSSLSYRGASVDLVDGSELPTGRIVLLYDALYFTAENAPDSLPA